MVKVVATELVAVMEKMNISGFFPWSMTHLHLKSIQKKGKGMFAKTNQIIGMEIANWPHFLLDAMPHGRS